MAAVRVRCPSCGHVFAPPAGASRFFCPRCGKRLEVAAPQPAPQPAPAPQPTPQPQSAPDPTPTPTSGQTGESQAVRLVPLTIHDDASGYDLMRVLAPESWRVEETSLTRTSNVSSAVEARVVLVDGRGAHVSVFTGPAGTRNSAGMRRAMAVYGGAIAGVDRTNYAEVMDPRQVADEFAAAVAKAGDATTPRLVAQLKSPDLPRRKEEAREHFQRLAGVQSAVIVDPFAAEVLRIFEVTYPDGSPWRIGVYVRLFCVKDGSGVDHMMMGGMLGGPMGGLVGTLIGSARRKGAERARAGAPATDGAWASADYDDYVRDGTIYWEIDCIANVMAPAADFERACNEAFLPVCRTVERAADVWEVKLRETMNHAAQIQSATNAQISRMNAQHQAQMAAMRRTQAAMDERNAQWLRDSDAHHQAFRERTNAQFGNSSGSAPDFSEAIRGVNTYVTSDGREVEVGVWADRAYENQAGDVIGASGGFEPSSDWTEIPLA